MSTAQSIEAGTSRFFKAPHGSGQPLMQSENSRDGAINTKECESVEGTGMTEVQSIEASIQTFFRGLRKGDLPLVQAHFTQDAAITFYQDGGCTVRGLGGYLVQLAEAPHRALELTIEGVDAVGDTAHAYVKTYCAAGEAVKFLSLVKQADAWRIAGLAVLRQ